MFVIIQYPKFEGTLIEVTHVTISDIDAIEAIANAGNLARWSVADYLNEFSRSDSLFFKAVTDADTKCSGFILGRIIPAINSETGVDAEIYNIGVVPVERRRGIGSMLIRFFLEECQNRSIKSVWLEVRKGNSAAISFYSKHKFAGVTIRKSFYRDPIEDAIVMRSNLYESLQTEA